MREELIRKVLEKKIIAIVRGVYGKDCLHLAQALYAGGIEMLEVTFDQSNTESFAKTSDTVRLLCDELGSCMDFGAGTVTSVEMLDMAEKAGASFVVSPNVDKEVIHKTITDGLVSMPGALTPTEVLNAHQYGADFVKIFPAATLGAPYVKAIRGPINHVRLLAVGGVNENNIADFIHAGCCGAGVGGNLVNKAWINDGKFDDITALAKQFVINAQ